MNMRLAKAFERVKQTKEAAFVAYLTAGVGARLHTLKPQNTRALD
jgi:tryptophan synthase alpha subunit